MIIILILIFVLPLLWILVGSIIEKHYSDFPDTTCGYHIGKLAPKNMDTWQTANEYAGKAFKAIGIMTLIVNLMVILIFFGMSGMLNMKLKTMLIFLSAYFYFMLIVILLFVPIFTTQKMLKKTFNSDGSRK